MAHQKSVTATPQEPVHEGPLKGHHNYRECCTRHGVFAQACEYRQRMGCCILRLFWDTGGFALCQAQEELLKSQWNVSFPG